MYIISRDRQVIGCIKNIKYDCSHLPEKKFTKNIVRFTKLRQYLELLPFADNLKFTE